MRVGWRVRFTGERSCAHDESDTDKHREGGETRTTRKNTEVTAVTHIPLHFTNAVHFKKKKKKNPVNKNTLNKMYFFNGLKDEDG